MKKILMIGLSVLLILFIILGPYFSKIYGAFMLYRYNQKYDYIVAGNNCNCQTFGKCKYSYVSKNGVFEQIDYQFNEDKSNFYKPIIGLETPTYFPVALYQQMNKDYGYRLCYDCPEYEKAIQEYSAKYHYREKDQVVFHKIMEILDQKELRNIAYFIITDDNYYIFNSYKWEVYQYNPNTNSLDFLVTTNTCDLDYFYEKKKSK